MTSETAGDVPQGAGGALALAERCENATGADRELDLFTALAVGAVDARTVFNGRTHGYVDRNQWAESRVPSYTASLDAAITLVPESVREWHAGKHHKTGQGQAYIICAGVLRDPIYCLAATPALALCAAALRARAHPGDPS